MKDPLKMDEDKGRDDKDEEFDIKEKPSSVHVKESMLDGDIWIIGERGPHQHLNQSS